jgi:Mitochondrial ribosomal protein (VAR1)
MPKMENEYLGSLNTNNSSLKQLNSSIISNSPVIFKKKKNKVIYKPLEYVVNDMGKMRHFPPGAQEWLNSVYNYNKNQTKTLPVLDKTLMNLLKSYYNMQINHKLLNIKRRVNRFRRLSPRKVFVGKGELKHTNSKVIITLYLYNTEKMYLIRELKKQFKYLFLARFPIIIAYSRDRNDEKIISYNRPFTLQEFLESPQESKVRYKRYPLKIVKNMLTYREIYLSTLESSVEKLTSYLAGISEYYKYLTILVEKKLLNNKEKSMLFINKVPNFDFLNKYPKIEDNIEIARWNYLKKLRRFFYLLRVNVAKSDPRLLTKLAYIIKNMYNKEVEFNVIELNRMHLNSDIFTQAIALKLKNRKNRLFRVLRSSLSRVNLPNVNRRSERYYDFNRDDLLVNKIRNSYISSMIDDKVKNRDSLNELLLGLFTSSENLEIEYKGKNLSGSKLSVSLETYVLKSLKHLKLAGVRVEAKGRLTKRFTASKSVFKMRWKGGLKNVDSSFKGLSAVMLRGIVKSNVQYSLINSKTRNGAFGIKGWVASK